jgi:hypothetical protein
MGTSDGDQMTNFDVLAPGQFAGSGWTSVTVTR